jgi:methyl-accepting chemotaxis protein
MVEQSTAASHSLTQEAEELISLVSRFQTGIAPSQTQTNARAKAKPKTNAYPPVLQQRERVARFASNSSSAALKADDDWQEF